ncbi:MAG: TPM domain-containing protein, partial [Gemmatimonadales bacterium]|nr:TPM domain-containing protein [Gemmatimonadales bacterium]
MRTLAVVLALELQIPAPIGFVNDFARVIERPAAAAMERTVAEVREKSGGEIVVVTMRDLGGRPASDVARDIGRQWRVGARGGAGDRGRNAGVVLLLKPGARP